MTLNEVCKLPNRTLIHLANGTVGRLAAVHQASKAVSVELQAGGVRMIPCERLVVSAIGVAEDSA
jgi:hypothetical protein